MSIRLDDEGAWARLLTGKTSPTGRKRIQGSTPGIGGKGSGRGAPSVNSASFSVSFLGASVLFLRADASDFQLFMGDARRG